MWNAEAVSISLDCSESSCVLSEEILAMELISTPTGQMQLGPLCSLPKGAEIEVCGAGFNDRTTKIRSHGQFFFVFLQDLENQSPRAECAWA